MLTETARIRTRGAVTASPARRARARSRTARPRCRTSSTPRSRSGPRTTSPRRPPLAGWLAARGLLDPGRAVPTRAHSSGPARCAAVPPRARARATRAGSAAGCRVGRAVIARARCVSGSRSSSADGGAPSRRAAPATGVDRALGATRRRDRCRRRRATERGRRLKACRKESCGWVFYDHSRNRSSNWCSMTICGNRTKTTGYRRRRDAAPEVGSSTSSRSPGGGFGGVRRVLCSRPRGSPSARPCSSAFSPARRRAGSQRLAGGRADPGSLALGPRRVVRSAGRARPVLPRARPHRSIPSSPVSGLPGPTAIVLFRESTVAGHFVSLAGVDGLASSRSADERHGSRTRCTPARCEVLRLAGSGRCPNAPGLRLVQVGTGTLRSSQLFGDFLAPTDNALADREVAPCAPAGRLVSPPAAGAARRRGGDRAADARAGGSRTPTAATPGCGRSRPGAPRLWQIDDLVARQRARARGALRHARSATACRRRVEELRAAERAATVAGRRLLLVGGEAAALLFAFAVLAARSMRRDLEAARRRLTWYGARRWQLGLLTGDRERVSSRSSAPSSAGSSASRPARSPLPSRSAGRARFCARACSSPAGLALVAAVIVSRHRRHRRRDLDAARGRRAASGPRRCGRRCGRGRRRVAPRRRRRRVAARRAVRAPASCCSSCRG